jgi:membrane associated rhomboid family serine protease
MVIALSALALVVMIAQALVPNLLAAGGVDAWGFQPARIAAVLADGLSGRDDLALGGLVTALFAHSNWLHLLGNLAYLWVFGIAVERALGHLRFALLFIVLGAVANLFVALQVPELDRVIIGASGGVSAIIGVYLGLFPARRIGLWLPLGLFPQFARIPALLVIGSWFTLQLLYTVFGPMTDAVAWWTHVAGFLAGLAVALLLRLMPGSARILREG